MNGSPTRSSQPGGSGGYMPTQFRSPGAMSQNNFWGVLLDENYTPSDLFCRLSDALFFHIDAQAEAANPSNGWMEPDKMLWWGIATGIEEDKQAARWVAKYAMESLYGVMGVPYPLVQDSNGHPLPLLDREGFLHALLAASRTDPSLQIQKLNRSITMFRLVDPLTSIPFPAPIPANSMPQIEDAYYRQIYQQWIATSSVQYQTHSMVKDAKRSSQTKIATGLFHTLLGGGLGGGGGVTGFGI